jgi:hypothetical protein
MMPGIQDQANCLDSEGRKEEVGSLSLKLFSSFEINHVIRKQSVWSKVTGVHFVSTDVDTMLIQFLVILLFETQNPPSSSR